MRRAALALVLAAACGAAALAPPQDGWTGAELASILRLSPPPQLSVDSTNRLSGQRGAIAFGAALFSDERLSVSRSRACDGCHKIEASLAGAQALDLKDDGKRLTRHTPGLWDVSHSRWFFWDGRTDTLWGQTLEALQDDLGASASSVAALVRTDRELSALLCTAAGPNALVQTDEAIFVQAGKSLAAYVETLQSQPSAFDDYVTALRTGRPSNYGQREKLGLRIFIGSGGCLNCHSGPRFTDGEFHNNRIAPPGGRDMEDPGRFSGVARLRTARYSAGGPFSDDPKGSRAQLSGLQTSSPHLWGQFKTPTLRNLASRRHFMHEGQLTSLEQVVEHYSTLEDALPAHIHHEKLIQPIHLSAREKAALVAFLRSLDGNPKRLPARIDQPLSPCADESKR